MKVKGYIEVTASEFDELGVDIQKAASIVRGRSVKRLPLEVLHGSTEAPCIYWKGLALVRSEHV